MPTSPLPRLLMVFDEEPQQSELSLQFPTLRFCNLRLRRRKSLVVLESAPILAVSLILGIGAFLVAATAFYFGFPDQRDALPFLLQEGQGAWTLMVAWILIFPIVIGVLCNAAKMRSKMGPGAIYNLETQKVTLPWADCTVPVERIIRLVEVRRTATVFGQDSLQVQGGLLFRTEDDRYGYAPIGFGLRREDLTVLRHFAKGLKITVQSVGRVTEDAWQESRRFEGL